MKAELWNALAKTTSTPLRAPLAFAFSGQSLESVWSDFEPSTSRLDDLTVVWESSCANKFVTEAHAKLLEHGVVVISGLVDPALVQAAADEVDAFMREILEKTATGKKHGELMSAVWQVGHSVIPTYLGMVRHEKPVVFIRARDEATPDAGMVDIFQLDRLADAAPLKAVKDLLRSNYSYITAEVVRRIQRVKSVARNLYFNEGVTNTRGLHIDSLEASYKAFIYLKDVTDLQSGPYTYVPGSHLEKKRLSKSVFLNRSRGCCECDIPMLKGREVPMLGTAGTVIISSQAGVHGGHPQSPEGRRSAIVTNYLQI